MSRRVEASYLDVWKRSETKTLISENPNLAE
jgi:hypothetical protein